MYTEEDAPAVPNPSRRLVLASFAYLMWATMGAAVAIVQGMPAEFGGIKSDRAAWRDFIQGMGTALSPPLWWMIPQAALTLLAARRGPAGTVAVVLLTLTGLAEFIGAAGEPITLRVLHPDTFEPLLAVIQVGMIVLPILILIFGVRTLKYRWATRAG